MEFNTLLSTTEINMQKAIKHLETEFTQIRTGRASSALVENLTVESYGTKSPLKALASISIPDATTVVIQPWDRNSIANIEKAFQNSNLGLNPNNEGTLLRINIPKPTEEKRKELIKVINDKSETAKISLRNERQNLHHAIKEMKQNSEITEDDFYNYEKQIQTIIDKYTKSIEELTAKKEAELMTI